MESLKPNVFLDADAGIFFSDLAETKRPWKAIKQALVTAIQNPDGYLDSYYAGAAWAAAELVAFVRGHPKNDSDNDLADLVGLRAPKNIPEITKLAVAAIERVEANSERAELFEDAGRKSEWLGEIGDLKRRLSEPAFQLSKKPNRTKVKVKPGDVFQLDLQGEGYAYGRLAQHGAFYVYAERTHEPNRPPIGSRNYLFYQVGLTGELERGGCPIVGEDPWIDGSSELNPHFYRGHFPVLHVHDARGTEILKRASNSDCFGLERLMIYSVADVVERILEGESGPAARKSWPLLPDGEGQLKTMPWSEWRPENDKKYVFDRGEYNKALATRHQEYVQVWKAFEEKRKR